MNGKKIAILVAILSILTFAGVVGVGAIRAQDSDGYPPLVQKLVERFNLDAGEVQEVFDEAREERHQEMQARFEEKLDQAVEEGTITEEQKEALLAKKAEMREKHEEMKDLSPEERREAMQQFREEMKTWMEENEIDLGLALGGKLGGPRGGFFFGK